MFRERPELNTDNTENSDKQKKNSGDTEHHEHVERGFIEAKERACRLTGCVTGQMIVVEGNRRENIPHIFGYEMNKL